MTDLIAIFPIAAGAYVATNLDNFVLLVSLLAHYRHHRSEVVAAYFTAAFTFGFVGFWLSEIASKAPVEYLGYLGLAPISIGVIGLVRLHRGKTSSEANEVAADYAAKGVFTVTLFIQLGNGADTIVVFGALFTDSMRSADLLIMMTMIAMAAFFVLIGNYAMRHPGLSKWIDRYAQRIMPFVLIAVGAYILANTATDLVPD